MPKSKADGPAAEEEWVRFPVRISRELRRRLRMLALRADMSAEVLAGEWLTERVAQEEKKLR